MDLAGPDAKDEELPPAARAAVAAARAEADALRDEVARLRRCLDEAELLADRDPLTPVLNRRAFIRELSRTIAFCERYGAPASLVFIDLDGFKAVNDIHGHAAGDAALHWVACALADNVRESDLVGRLGGDEFGVILVQATREAAEAKAADLQHRIESEPVVFDGRSIRIRLSYGVRTFEPGIEAAQFLAEADAAMFLNKAERRT